MTLPGQLTLLMSRINLDLEDAKKAKSFDKLLDACVYIKSVSAMLNRMTSDFEVQEIPKRELKDAKAWQWELQTYFSDNYVRVSDKIAEYVGTSTSGERDDM